MAEQSIKKQYPENYILVSAKSNKVQRGEETRFEYDVSDEKYLVSIEHVFKNHNECIVMGRGKAIQRCVKFATHKMLKDTIASEKTKIKVGSDEMENERDGRKSNAMVEYIEITLHRK